MSHDSTIHTRPPGGGFVAAESLVEGSVKWTVPHDLAPAKERRRLDRAQVKLDEIVAILTAPVEAADE